MLNGKKTSWSHTTFYNKDKVLLEPKLTNSHLHPTNFEKIKVKFAAHVLSHSVANGTNTYISLVNIPLLKNKL